MASSSLRRRSYICVRSCVSSRRSRSLEAKLAQIATDRILPDHDADFLDDLLAVHRGAAPTFELDTPRRDFRSGGGVFAHVLGEIGLQLALQGLLNFAAP